MKSDVVIIGGGVSGLATGALLAHAGKRVAVLEKGNVPGGRAYAYEDRGFTLNYGAHAMYRPESGFLAELMLRLGRPTPRCSYPEPMRAYWSDGERFAAVGAKPQQVLTTLLFPLAGRLQLAKFMLALQRAKPHELDEDMTWGAWVERQTGDAAVRRFARAFATVNTYTRPSGKLSARFVVAALQRNAFAKDYAGYMWGGWRSMYDAFIDEITTRGGELRTGARVERLELDGGRVVAALTDDGRYDAEAFVCTLPPLDAPAIAPPGSPLAAELAGWSGLVDVRALCMDLGFSRRLRDDLTFVFDIERDLYYSLHSEVAHDLAPPGSQLLHAMAYLSPEEAADGMLVARRKADLTDGLDRFFPGWREALVVERTLPGVHVVSARSTPEQFGRGRVPLRAGCASNLYFAGDGRDLPYNLTEICLASAMEAADAVFAGSGAREAAVAIQAGGALKPLKMEDRG